MLHRRTLLKSGIGLGAIKLLGSVSASSDSLTFGDFEDGIDGWKTENQNTLSLVDNSEIISDLIIGSQALSGEVSGDPGTKIYKESNLESVDFRSHPYLFAYVIPSTVNDGGSRTELATDFEFRFYILNMEEDEVIALKSEVQTVSPHSPQYISFDMSSVLAELYSTVDDESNLIPQRLEIFWEPSADDNNLSSIDYSGEVIFDDIGATSVETDYSLRALTQTRAELMEAHGQLIHTHIETQSSTQEEGTLEFSDGFTVDYTIEELAPNRFEYTIPGLPTDESYVIEVGN